MTKLNKEIIAEIAGQFETMGEANKAIGMLLAKLNSGEVTEAPATKADKKKPAKKEVVVVEEPEVEEEPEDEDEDEEGLTAEDLEEMSLKELKALATENEIEFPKTAKKPKMIEIISEYLSDDEEEEAPEDEDEDAEGEDVDLDEMDAEELKAFIRDNGLGNTPRIKKTEKPKAYEERLRDFIQAAMTEVEEPEEEEEEEAPVKNATSIAIENEDGDEEYLDLATMNLAELKEFADENGLEAKSKKKTALIKEIIEQVEADEDEDEEEEEEDMAEQLGLNDMSVEDLAEILEENGLSTKGKKQSLVDRVLKGIEDGTIEMDDEEGN